MKAENSTEHWFNKLMDSKGGVYQTGNGIEIYTYPDGSLYLRSDYPEKNVTAYDVELVICRIYTAASELMDAFGIKSEADLQKLTPRDMLLEYEKGAADICASLEEMDYVWDLTFRTVDTVTYISDDDTERIWQQNVPLLTAANIIGYVQQYATEHSARLKEAKLFRI